MKLIIQKAKKISSKLPRIRVKFENSISYNFGNTKDNKKGLGEEFWDFKEYKLGDSLKKIDWKKSSKFQKLFVKNNENESSNNIWFWKSKSVSMNYKSSKIVDTKAERSMLIGLIMIDIFLRSGDKVGIIGSNLGLKNGQDNFLSLAHEFEKKSFFFF